ncbi:MAG: hypothetical protein JXJ19_06835 [Elusimicrobia bacterium]|nr:hypothetical protein [Elusimicrobiota bacterium]
MTAAPDRKKYAVTVVRVLLVLLSVEVALRICESGYYYYCARAPMFRDLVDDSAYRIICVGESTVQGHEVEERYSFPKVLEKMLSERYPDRNIRVYKLGILGVTVSKIAENFRGYLDHYRPHLVILLVGHNNYHVIIDEDVAKNEKSSLIPYSFYLMKRAKLFKLGAFLAGMYRKNVYGRIFDIRDKNIIDARAIYKKRFVKDIEYMIKESRRVNADVILCNYFRSWFNEYAQGIAQKNGTYFCDNQKVAEEYISGGREREIFYSDNWHPSIKGYSLIAGNLFGLITEKKLVD